MLTQMFVVFPLLMLGGWATSRLAHWLPHWGARLARCDAHGLAGGTAINMVAAVWMLPVALDLATLSDAMATAKLASWWLVGMALPSSWGRASPTVRIFFLGNLAWMTATAGLLYQEGEQRLCVSYLLDDQLWAGRALVSLAVALTGALCWVGLRSPR